MVAKRCGKGDGLWDIERQIDREMRDRERQKDRGRYCLRVSYGIAIGQSQESYGEMKK